MTPFGSSNGTPTLSCSSSMGWSTCLKIPEPCRMGPFWQLLCPLGARSIFFHRCFPFLAGTLPRFCLRINQLVALLHKFVKEVLKIRTFPCGMILPFYAPQPQGDASFFRPHGGHLKNSNNTFNLMATERKGNHYHNLAKLLYFTNLDFLEIRWFPFLSYGRVRSLEFDQHNSHATMMLRHGCAAVLLPNQHSCFVQSSPPVQVGASGWMLGSMGYNLLTNEVYWGYNPLTNLLEHPKQTHNSLPNCLWEMLPRKRSHLASPQIPCSGYSSGPFAIGWRLPKSLKPPPSL